jgi:glycosyltransferase involved in cell wall biosynthesis
MTHPHPYLGYWDTLEKLFGPRKGISRKLFAGLKLAAPYLAQSVYLLACQIRRDNCRAILCQDYEHAGFDRAILVGRLLRLPVFAIFQGGVRDWNAIGRRLRPITMRMCSGLIIGPIAEAERVRKEYGIDPSKAIQIFNPLSKDIWENTNRRLARKKLNLPIEAQIISWHGRIEILKKGLDVLIESFVRLVQGGRHSNIHFAILGAGPDSERFVRKLEPVRSRVSWIDRFVSDREFIRMFLSAGGVYAFPSRMGGVASCADGGNGLRATRRSHACEWRP